VINVQLPVASGMIFKYIELPFPGVPPEYYQADGNRRKDGDDNNPGYRFINITVTAGGNIGYGGFQENENDDWA
jgi:hypothetical protein